MGLGPVDLDFQNMERQILDNAPQNQQPEQEEPAAAQVEYLCQQCAIVLESIGEAVQVGDVLVLKGVFLYVVGM